MAGTSREKTGHDSKKLPFPDLALMSAHAVSTPRRMIGLPLMPERGTVSAFELVLLAVCVVLVAVRLPQNIQDVVILTFLWAGLALAWNIAGGYAGLISFGHAAFFGIGAYTSTILGVKLEITPWIGIWLGGLLCAACGALLAVICARLRGPFFILSTLAAAEVVRIGALNWASLTGGPEGIAILPTPSLGNMVFAGKSAYAVLMLVYLVAVYVATKLIEGSRYGYRLFAVRDDEDAASAAGINPLWMRTSAMAISAFITGIGGSLFAQYFLYLDPTHVISPELSFQFALLPALGGLGSAIGPVLGSFAITPLSELLRSYLGDLAHGLHLAIYGGVVIVVMLYFPSGIAGVLERLARRGRRGSTP
jgi:branched-chain amino acid transport system permease protein